ncbi:hypothetical protein Tco_0865735 [Tanacetum coccineum]
MSTSAYVDSETITQADGAQGSRVPIPLLDYKTSGDARSWYMISGDANACHAALAVLHDALRALVDMLLVAMLIEDVPLVVMLPRVGSSEAEKQQPLGSRVPLMSEEFEASELSGTRTISSHSLVSSGSTTPLSPDHPLTHVLPTPTPTRVSFHRRTARMAMRTQPTLSPGMSARIAKAAALSISFFRKRYRSSYETPSPSSSLALPVRKRYRGTEEDEEDKSSDADDERERPEGQQQTVLVVDTSASEPLGLGYGAARRRALESTEEIAPSTYEVGQSSRSMPEQEGAERVSAFRQPTLVTWVDPEDGKVYTDIPTNVSPAAPVRTPPSPEWLLGSLPISPSSLVVPSPIASPVATPAATISQRLDALPPALFEDYDRDLRELYTRSGAVRDEIFSQRAVLWHAIYDIQRDNQDLRRQLAEERRERLKLTDRVARMERRQKSGGE